MNLFNLLTVTGLIFGTLARADDVYIGTIDVTAIMDNLAPQTKTCLKTIPGFSFPITRDEIVSLCANINTLLPGVSDCMTAANSPPGDQALISLLPSACSSLPPVATSFSSSRVIRAPTTTEQEDQASSSSQAAFPASIATTLVPDETTATTVAAPPATTSTDTSQDIIVMGYDVTQLVANLSPCTKACLAAVPGITFPLLKSEIPVLCPNVQAYSAQLKTCCSANKCPANEATYMGLLPGFCVSLMASVNKASSTTSGLSKIAAGSSVVAENSNSAVTSLNITSSAVPQIQVSLVGLAITAALAFAM